MRRLVFPLLLATACAADLGSPSEPEAGEGGSSLPGRPPGQPGQPGQPGLPDLPPTPREEPAGIMPRLIRLSHTQWSNSIQDVLGFDARGTAEMLRSDAGGGGFLFEARTDLSVDDVLWEGYRRAADEVARGVVQDAALLSPLLSEAPDGASDEERARALIEAVGPRLLRRPLSETDAAAYLDVFRAGASDGFESALELMLSAFLQSPRFLYRVELDGQTVGDQLFVDAHALAARLSYFIWNTTPDDALLAAAADGTLLDLEVLEAQARRLLEDPRATEVVQRMHETLLKTDRYDGISPNPTFFPDVTDRLPELAREETQRFLRALYDEDLGYREMMTSRTTFVEENLAELYGLEGNFGSEFQRVELPESERSGLFTQIGFLASNASSVNPDSIHRGVFMNNYIVCNPVNPPPDDIPPLPPTMGRTNRETVEMHTEQPGSSCEGCHGPYINPFGFAFESYDAVGGFRTMDGDHPVDTRVEPFINGVMTPVSGALELTQVLADHPTAHACFAEHWVEYGLGRPRTTAEDAVIDRLGELSRSGASIKELLVAFATSQPFRARSTEDYE